MSFLEVALDTAMNFPGWIARPGANHEVYCRVAARDLPVLAAAYLREKGRVENCIASEREAAADRGDDWLDEQVKSSGMEDNPAFERLRLKQHASLRAKIVDGQSASPKAKLHTPGEVVTYASGDPCPRCGTPLGRVALNAGNWHIVCPHCPADFGDANGPDGKAHNDGMSLEIVAYYEKVAKEEYPEPAVPLQEARDREERLALELKWISEYANTYSDNEGVEVCGNRARAALAAEGKA
jgi:uncharacterized Zn finger protein (UPF0148 family)